MLKTIASLAFAAALLPSAQAASVTLGSFQFESSQFGNSLSASDGGASAAGNWLNTSNASPGMAGYLTGAHFNTGIANIGGDIAYSIGYDVPILNAAGSDFGVVVARYSSDDFRIAVSLDGISFGSDVTVLAGTAASTGESRDYFYNGFGPINAGLFVHSLDLSDFGIGAGASIKAIRITGFNQLDLIRAAAFTDRIGGGNQVPEPAGFALAGLALLAAFFRPSRSPLNGAWPAQASGSARWAGVQAHIIIPPVTSSTVPVT